MGEFRYRQAAYEASDYQGEPLNLAEDFNGILENGNLIDTHTTGGGVRVVRIVGAESGAGHNTGPLLGYGQDKTIEGALRRARDTYTRREAEGVTKITIGAKPQQWPESGIDIYTGAPQIGSPLDGIAFMQGFRAYREGDQVVVQTKYGGFAVEPLVGRGSTLEEAVDTMCGRLGN